MGGKSKVAVLGAAGGIGQPLSLLLKLSPNVGELSCYDIVGTPGVAADLSHIPTGSSVTGNLPAAGSWPPTHNTGLEAALTGADVVVIPAGVPRKPGMTRDDLFNTNAGTFSFPFLFPLSYFVLAFFLFFCVWPGAKDTNNLCFSVHPNLVHKSLSTVVLLVVDESVGYHCVLS